ncbi:CAMK/CAMKL protein kinase [Salpingoeca rosetta]|uniref:non-specific serine/threonine protein kinase n=1 Tax=Salpingoeca rosetta (strain ATCC 50818 / BSB-021) TaxID=946362 RepID=F2U8G6_SALR5|nr:CAMK/CAMKL protein kinase [Salpingoeca rosetta]EGD72674.1 CAMK/CAMKL protein kinase [Salpingoeca rosetta]|eukprot:XP_004994497.1 CAMK/CAMKL protein kinase [Salpingoeca rosetta]
MSMTSIEGLSPTNAPALDAHHYASIKGVHESEDLQSIPEEVREEQDNALAQLQQYQVGETLGVGAHGEVKRATHKLSGQSVAIKFVPREDCKDGGKRLTEVAALRMLNHPHVVRLYDVIRTSTQVLLVLECLPGGELFDYLVSRHRLSESEGRRFTRQIMSALTYCHDQGIVHRDLKLENLLLDDDGDVKVTDFGFSNVYKDGNLMSTFVGSPAYAAPEIMANEKYSGPKADIWSLGVIVYTLLSGEMPFQADNIADKLRHITQAEYEMPPYLSSDAQHLIQLVLQRDPEARPSMEELWQHPWISQSGKLQPLIVEVPPPSEALVQRCMQEIAAQTDIDIAHLRACLKENKITRATATYHLLLNKLAQEAKREEKDNEIQRIIAGLKSLTPGNSRSGSPLLFLRPSVDAGRVQGEHAHGDDGTESEHQEEEVQQQVHAHAHAHVHVHEHDMHHHHSDLSVMMHMPEAPTTAERPHSASSNTHLEEGMRARSRTDGQASQMAATWRVAHRRAAFRQQATINGAVSSSSMDGGVPPYATPSRRRRNSHSDHPLAHSSAGPAVARRSIALGASAPHSPPVRLRRMTAIEPGSPTHPRHPHYHAHQYAAAANGSAGRSRLSVSGVSSAGRTRRRRVSTLGTLVETRDEEVSIRTTVRSPTGSRLALLSHSASREHMRHHMMMGTTTHGSVSSIGALSDESAGSSRKSSATSSHAASPAQYHAHAHNHVFHQQHAHSHLSHAQAAMQPNPTQSEPRTGSKSAEDISSSSPSSATPAGAAKARRHRRRSNTTAGHTPLPSSLASPRRPSHKVTMLGNTPQTFELEVSPLPARRRRASRTRRSSLLGHLHTTNLFFGSNSDSARPSIEFSDAASPVPRMQGRTPANTTPGMEEDAFSNSSSSASERGNARDSIAFSDAESKRSSDTAPFVLDSVPAARRRAESPVVVNVTNVDRLVTTSDEQLMLQRKRATRKQQRTQLSRLHKSEDAAHAYEYGAHSDGAYLDTTDDDYDYDDVGGNFDEEEEEAAAIMEQQERQDVGEFTPRANSTESLDMSRTSSRRSSNTTQLLDVRPPRLEARRRSSSTGHLPSLIENQIAEVFSEEDTAVESDSGVPQAMATSPAGAVGDASMAAAGMQDGGAIVSPISALAGAVSTTTASDGTQAGMPPTSPTAVKTRKVSTRRTKRSSRGSRGSRGSPRMTRATSISNLTKSMKRKKGMDALDLASSMRAFGAATTSIKPAHVIIHELKQALRSCDVMFEERGPVKLRCSRVAQAGGPEHALRARRNSLISMETIVWEITVQVLPDLNMRGIHLRRIKGNHWDYKKLVDEVIRKAKL